MHAGKKTGRSRSLIDQDYESGRVVLAVLKLTRTTTSFDFPVL